MSLDVPSALRKHHAWFSLVAAALLVVSVYANSIGHAEYGVDPLRQNPVATIAAPVDWLHLARSPRLAETLVDGRAVRFEPLADISLAMTRGVGGASSVLLGNLALHFACMAILLAILRSGRSASPGAVVAVTLFGVAPVNSEAILSAAGRSHILAGVLLLVALLFNRRDERRFQVAATLCALAATLASEDWVLAPFILVAADLTLARRSLRFASPKLAAALIGVVALLLVRRSLGATSAFTVPAGADGWTVAGAFVSVVTAFLRATFDAAHLDALHTLHAPIPFDIAVGFLPFGVVAALIWRSRNQTHYANRLATFGFALLLVSGTAARVAVRALRTGHFGDGSAYLTAIGVAVVLGQAIDLALAEVSRAGASALQARSTLGALAAFLWIGVGWSTAGRASQWQDAETLLASSLAADPSNPSACIGLALLAVERRRFDRAKEYARQAVAAEALSWRAWSAMCVVLRRSGELNEARDACDRGAVLGNGEAAPRAELAAVHRAREDWRRALQAAEDSLAIDPTQSAVRCMRDEAKVSLGQGGDAASGCAKLIRERFGEGGGKAGDAD